MSTPLSITLRLERVLRFIAAHPGTRIAEASKTHGIPAPEIWQWLKENNQSRPQISDSLVTRVIENARRKDLDHDGDTPPPTKAAVVAAAAVKPRISPRPTPVIRTTFAKVETPMPAAVKPLIPLTGPNLSGEQWLEQQNAPIAHHVKTYIVYVTPAMAARWLTLNQGNRKPSRAKVRRFADVIRSGKWTMNGEAVKFSDSGRLLDGQSRLRAIIEANTPAPLELRFGIPDEAQRTMDAGESRRATHALEMLGYQNAHVLSPALRFVFQMEGGGIRKGGSTTGRQSVMENLAVPALIKRHDALTRSVEWAIAQGQTLRKLLPFSEAAFFHYVFAGAGVDKRDAFFAALIPPKHARLSGNNRSDASPTGLLRNRLVANIGGKISATARVKITVKAWNAFARSLPLAELTLTPMENCAPIFGSEQVIKAA